MTNPYMPNTPEHRVFEAAQGGGTLSDDEVLQAAGWVPHDGTALREDLLTLYRDYGRQGSEPPQAAADQAGPGQRERAADDGEPGPSRGPVLGGEQLGDVETEPAGPDPELEDDSPHERGPADPPGTSPGTEAASDEPEREALGGGPLPDDVTEVGPGAYLIEGPGSEIESRRLMAFIDTSPGEPAEPPMHYEYDGFYPGSDLDVISKADPDGGEHEPTKADYQRFEDWVVRTYGRETWESYRGTDREAE